MTQEQAVQLEASYRELKDSYKYIVTEYANQKFFMIAADFNNTKDELIDMFAESDKSGLIMHEDAVILKTDNYEFALGLLPNIKKYKSII